MEDFITIENLKQHLDKLIVLRRAKEKRLDALRKEEKEAKALSDLFKIDQISLELKALPVAIRTIDDVIGELEPLFKLVDGLDQKSN